MATEVVTLLRDDLDGSTAERTVSFSWDGTSYQIDLSKKNIAELSAILQPYVAVARNAGGRGRRSGRTGRGTSASGNKSGVDLAAVRSWAAANGHSVAARGRISSAILDAFKASSGTGGSGTSAKPPAKATRAASARRGATKRGAPARRRAAKG